MNLVFGVWNLVVGIITQKVIFAILGLLWILAPGICWYISKDIEEKEPINLVTNQDKEYLLDIAKKTWQYFKDNINAENNFLPPDNYQEDRKNKIARKNINYTYRTWYACGNICI